MDITQISSAIGTLSGAVNLVKIIKAGMNPLPDEIATSLAELNQKLINAQIAVMSVNKIILKQTEELRKLKETLSQKNNYSLVDIGKGRLVYRYNVPPVRGDSSDPISSEPPHYACQVCFDRDGIRSVLQRKTSPTPVVAGRSMGMFIASGEINFFGCLNCGTEFQV